MGRPTDYTPELADSICARLALGESLRSVCRDESMPCLTSVFTWIRKYPEFLKQYDVAKEESAESHSDYMLEIADNAANDYMEALGDEGGIAYRLNGENIQRSKLRVDTRKWLASKLKPKKYGEKLHQEVTGANGGPIQYETVPDDVLKKAAADLIKQLSTELKD